MSITSLKTLHPIETIYGGRSTCRNQYLNLFTHFVNLVYRMFDLLYRIVLIHFHVNFVHSFTEERRQPWLYGGVGLLIGFIIVLADQFLTDKPSIQVCTMKINLFFLHHAGEQ